MTTDTHRPTAAPRPGHTHAASGLALALALACGTAWAAPDEARYGAEQNYPLGTPSNWFRQDRLVGSYSAMEQVFTMRAVPAGGALRELPAHPTPPDWPFVQRHLDTHPATSLMVLQDGRVLLERYQYGRTADHRFTSFSMAKTLVGMAVGVALAEGRIASIDDAVDVYEPALAQSGWKGVPLRHVLNMASGVRFDETYDRADTDIAKLSRSWTQPRGSLLNALGAFKEQEVGSGTRFKYISADTQVLAQVLVKATGMPLADYVSQKIWRPMGAEADAAWVVDASGMEAAYCCFSARTRDWARLGLLLLDQGQREGQSIVPSAWVQAATHVRAEDPHLQPRQATPYFGYGYQTWIFPDGLGFALLGVRGQSVFVHPGKRLVMVQTGVWPQSTQPDLGRQRDALWRQVVKAAPDLTR